MLFHLLLLTGDWFFRVIEGALAFGALAGVGFTLWVVESEPRGNGLPEAETAAARTSVILPFLGLPRSQRNSASLTGEVAPFS